MILSHNIGCIRMASDTALGGRLGDSGERYNGAFDHRISAYAKGVAIRYNEQVAALPHIRRQLPHQGRRSATA